MKILLAVDGSPSSNAAVTEVAARPWEPESEVRVVSVIDSASPPAIEPFGVSRAYFAQIESAEKQWARNAVERAATKLRKGEGGRTLRITTGVLTGSPKRVLIEEAESFGADLIVLGSRGLGAWERLLLGSVSNSVAQHATCSVEIVRERK